MANFPAQTAVVLSGVGFILCIVWIAAYRPVFFLSFFFILFTLIWRTASTMFIDLAGPVYSSQTLHFIGPGLVTPLHVLTYLVTLASFFLLLRPAMVGYWLDKIDRRRAPSGMVTLSDLTVVTSALFVGYLFVDLARNGSIPLFAHIERFVYTARYAGAAHHWLVKYGNFLTFWWGIMFAAERLRNRKSDLRYLVLMGILLAYMLLRATASRRFTVLAASSLCLSPR